jgi:hypothetical protein
MIYIGNEILFETLIVENVKICEHYWRALKVLDRLKCEFEVKTTEEQKVEARS